VGLFLQYEGQSLKISPGAINNSAELEGAISKQRTAPKRAKLEALGGGWQEPGPKEMIPDAAGTSAAKVPIEGCPGCERSALVEEAGQGS